MMRMWDGTQLEKGVGEYPREILCCICKTAMKRVDGKGATAESIRPCEEIYVCDKGHVYSGEALIELDSYELL